MAARAVAIRRVVTNTGAKTPGVDKLIWDSSAKRMSALLLLGEITQNPKQYKASPLKRVWITKALTYEKRPLGIPSFYIYDRSCGSSRLSYGHRSYRRGTV
jgi:RNA-directed DNA polymerase